MRKISSVLAASVTLVVGLSTATRADDVGDPARGSAYAQKVCSECHAVLAHDVFSPNPDAPPFQTVAETTGMTHRALVVWLQSSHPTMPNIMIEASDRDDVIAYIMSLKLKPRPSGQ